MNHGKSTHVYCGYVLKIILRHHVQGWLCLKPQPKGKNTRKPEASGRASSQNQSNLENKGKGSGFLSLNSLTHEPKRSYPFAL